MYQWSVSLLSSRVYEVAKAATLWLFSHGVGGGRAARLQGHLQYWICRICQGLCTCDVNWTITSILSELFVLEQKKECSVYHQGSSSCSTTSRGFSVNSCKHGRVLTDKTHCYTFATDSSGLQYLECLGIKSFMFRCMLCHLHLLM